MKEKNRPEIALFFFFMKLKWLDIFVWVSILTMV